jgi:hypothetical protein
MSFHHQMMLQRYGLGRPTDMYSQVNADPIFTPIFTAAFGVGGIGFSAATATALATVATAITAGGDYWEIAL